MQNAFIKALTLYCIGSKVNVTLKPCMYNCQHFLIVPKPRMLPFRIKHVSMSLYCTLTLQQLGRLSSNTTSRSSMPVRSLTNPVHQSFKCSGASSITSLFKPTNGRNFASRMLASVLLRPIQGIAIEPSARRCAGVIVSKHASSWSRRVQPRRRVRKGRILRVKYS